MGRRILKQSVSLLHIDHAFLNNRWNYKNVISPYYRIYYIDEGEGFISGPGASLKLEPGYLYMVPSYTLCNMKCQEYLSQYFLHFFEESADGISLFYNNRTLMKVPASEIDVWNFKRLLTINPKRGINRSNNPKMYEKSVYYVEYQDLNNLQPEAVYIETQGIILQLLSRFIDHKKTDRDILSIPSKILDTITYVQMNINQPLTVTKLAKRINQHQDYFSRQFLQFTGQRPLTYIHEKRIERAQYLLTTTNMSYGEISSETGFENLPHFCRIFKKVTKVTPGQYRLQNRALNTLSQ
jgi:AraC-like DNA-binding protein